jgi:hypothetical protein
LIHAKLLLGIRAKGCQKFVKLLIKLVFGDWWIIATGVFFVFVFVFVFFIGRLEGGLLKMVMVVMVMVVVMVVCARRRWWYLVVHGHPN